MNCKLIMIIPLLFAVFSQVQGQESFEDTKRFEKKELEEHVQFEVKQRIAESRQRLEAIKIGYLTRELELTPDEAKQFWPVYDQYAAKRKEARQEVHALRKRHLNEDNELTEEEAEKMIKGINKVRKELEKIEDDLDRDLKGVLSAQKRLKLKLADEKFGRKVAHKLKTKKELKSRKEHMKRKREFERRELRKQDKIKG